MSKYFRVHDSFTGEEFPYHRIYSVTYEPIWQGIRRVTTRTFNSFEGFAASSARLDAYIFAADRNDPTERALRLYRVKNLLCAIPLGQASKEGIHFFPKQLEQAITKYREVITEAYGKLPRPTVWDWHWSRQNLIKIWQGSAVDALQLQRVATSLKNDRARRPEPKPELRYYLKMIQEIADGTVINHTFTV